MKRIRKRARLFPKLEQLESRHMMASDWQNSVQNRDVNNDLVVSPIDALLGINRLNANRAPLSTRPADSVEPFFDVSGDGEHSPLDVLLVINALNSQTPLVGVQLSKDLGKGPGGYRDRVTADGSINGAVSVGQATLLLGRVDQETGWRDLTRWFNAQTRRFAIPEAELATAFGSQLVDGPHILTFKAQNTLSGDSGVKSEEASIAVNIDRTRPSTNFSRSIVMQQADFIEIPFDEPLVSQTLDLTKISVRDRTYSDSTNDMKLVTPSKVSLSANGLKLRIEFAAGARPASYLVQVDQGALEDVAGNIVGRNGSSSPFQFRADYFATSTSSALEFGSTISTPVTLVQTVKEFTFDLSSPELFIWGGNRLFDSIDRFELFSNRGDVIRTFRSSNSVQPEFLTLPSGHYTLRVSAPQSFGSQFSGSQFRVYLGSQLNQTPLQNPTDPISNDWPFDLYQLSVAPDQLYFFENQESTGPGGGLKVIDFNGQPVQTTSFGKNQAVDVPAGKYLTVIDRVHYRLHASQRVTQPLTLDQWTEGTITSPGQQVVYTLTSSLQGSYFIEVDPTSTASFNAVRGNNVPLNFNIPVFKTAEAEAIRITVSSIQTATAVGYRFRIREIRTAPELPLQTNMPAPVSGNTEFYQFRVDSLTNFRFNIPYNYQLCRELADSVQPLVSFAPNLVPGRYFLTIKGNGNSAPWSLMGAETIVAPLVEGKGKGQFVTGQEQFKFNFTTTGAQWLTLESIGPFFITHTYTKIYDSLGNLVEPVEQWTTQNRLFPVWHLKHSGDYRVMVGLYNATPTDAGEFSFKLRSLDDVPLLEQGKIVSDSLGDEKVSVYRFRAQENRFFAHATQFSKHMQWTIWDDTGHNMLTFDMKDDLDFPVILGERYWLVITESYNTDPHNYQFSWMTAKTTVQQSTVGSPVTGTLAARGDRALIQIPLTQGQTLRLDQIGWDKNGVFGQWRELPNAQANIEGYPTITNAEQKWLVGGNRTASIELRNLSDFPQAYSFSVIDEALPTEPSSSLYSGFGQVYSGTLADFASTEVRFSMPAGGDFMFDWLVEGLDLFDVQLTTPSSNPIIVVAGDLPLKTAPESGEYTFKITNRRQQPSSYQFRLLTSALAEPIELDVPIQGRQIPPHATLLFRTTLPEPTELFLDAPQQFAVRYNNRNYLMIGIHKGSTVVVVENATEDPQPINFTVRRVAQIPNIPLDSQLTVPFRPGHWNVFPFVVDQPNTVLTILPKALAGFIADESGLSTNLEPFQDDVVGIKYPGKYRFVVNSFNQTESSIPLTILQQSTSEATINTDQLYSGSIQRTGDRLLVHAQLQADHRYYLFQKVDLFKVRSIVLIDPHGHRQNLVDRTFAIAETGRYTIEYISSDDQLDVQLMWADFASAGDIGTGITTIPVDLGMPFSLRKLSGDVSQLSFQNLTVQQSTVDFSNSYGLRLPLFSPSVYPMPADGQVYVAVFSDSPVKISLGISSTKIFDGVFGTKIQQRFNAAADRHIYRFNLDSVQAIRVSIDYSARGFLNTPLGSMPFADSVPLYATLQPGDYTVELIANFAADYTFRMDLLSLSPQLQVDSNSPLAFDTTYRLDVLTTGRFEFVLKDQNGELLPAEAISLASEFGRPIAMSSKVDLAAGAYWLRVDRGGPPYSITGLNLGIKSIVVSKLTGTIGESIAIDLGSNGDKQVVVTYEIPSRMRLMFDQFPPPSMQVQWRLTSIPFVWTTLTDNRLPLVVGSPSTLEFRISGAAGAGQVNNWLGRLRLIDIDAAATLPNGTEITGKLDATTNLVVYSISPTLGSTLVIDDLDHTKRNGTWWLLDMDNLALVRPLDKSLSVSMVNGQRFILVLYTSARANIAYSLKARLV